MLIQTGTSKLVSDRDGRKLDGYHPVRRSHGIMNKTVTTKDNIIEEDIKTSSGEDSHEHKSHKTLFT